MEDDSEFRLAVIRGEVERARGLIGDAGRGDESDAGMTCFHYAAQHNDVDMLAMLTERSGREALWRAKNTRGNSPLHQAALSGSADTLKWMLKAGAEKERLNERNGWGETPLHLACQSNSEACIDALMERSDIDLEAKDKWDRTANDVYLDHTAGRVGLRSLKERKPKSSSSAPAPQQQQMQKPMRSLSKLIEAPLHFEEFQLHLVDESVNIWGKDMFGLTALHKVCAWNHEKALVLLLERATDASVINAPDLDGNTGLHHAAMMGADRTYAILSQHPHCNASATNKAGKTAADLLI